MWNEECLDWINGISRHTVDDAASLRSQIATSKRGGARYVPYALNLTLSICDAVGHELNDLAKSTTCGLRKQSDFCQKHPEWAGSGRNCRAEAERRRTRANLDQNLDRCDPDPIQIDPDSDPDRLGEFTRKLGVFGLVTVSENTTPKSKTTPKESTRKHGHWEVLAVLPKEGGKV